MTAEHLREAAQTCDRAFDFLVEDLGYERARPRFDSHGFEVNYQGPVVAVQIDWYPRDPLTAWILTPGSAPNRFDLEDVEVISGHFREIDEARLYATPDDDIALLLANNLRTYASDLLRGDLTRLPQLSGRVTERSRTEA